MKEKRVDIKIIVDGKEFEHYATVLTEIEQKNFLQEIRNVVTKDVYWKNLRKWHKK